MKTTFNILLSLMMITLLGCSPEEGSMEKAGKKMDKAMEQAGEKTDKAMEQASDYVSEKKQEVEKMMEANAEQKK